MFAKASRKDNDTIKLNKLRIGSWNNSSYSCFYTRRWYNPSPSCNVLSIIIANVDNTFYKLCK
jgi:hypothetical protein